jgi:hypothetical protein
VSGSGDGGNGIVASVPLPAGVAVGAGAGTGVAEEPGTGVLTPPGNDDVPGAGAALAAPLPPETPTDGPVAVPAPQLAIPRVRRLAKKGRAACAYFI